MEQIRYSFLAVGTKFVLDDIEYTKSNHNRSFYRKNGLMIFRNIKKSKIVEVTNEISKHL